MRLGVLLLAAGVTVAALQDDAERLLNVASTCSAARFWRSGAGILGASIAADAGSWSLVGVALMAAPHAGALGVAGRA